MASTWRGLARTKRAPLRGQQHADVVIIGGGLTGVAAAYLLKDGGKRVALLEATELGAVATGMTSAFLVELIDTDAQTLIETRGETEAKQVLDAHRDAIGWIEEIAQKERIECEFLRCPIFLYGTHDDEVKELDRERAALLKLGRELHPTTLPFPTSSVQVLERQAKFHPLKFLYGLAERLGDVVLYEDSRVEAIQYEGERVRLTTMHGSITASHVLIATHYPLQQPLKLFFKKAKYVTYMFEARIPPGTFPEGLYEDLGNPYHYMRVDRQEGGDRLLFGGEDHRADVPISHETQFAHLEEELKRICPHSEIVRRWYGPIIEPSDGLAFIGPLTDPRLFYATGYSGNGLTHAVIAAHAFRDYLKDGTLGIFRADRRISALEYFSSAKSYLSEFWHGAALHILGL